MHTLSSAVWIVPKQNNSTLKVKLQGYLKLYQLLHRSEFFSHLAQKIKWLLRTYTTCFNTWSCLLTWQLFPLLANNVDSFDWRKMYRRFKPVIVLSVEYAGCKHEIQRFSIFQACKLEQKLFPKILFILFLIEAISDVCIMMFLL